MNFGTNFLHTTIGRSRYLLGISIIFPSNKKFRVLKTSTGSFRVVPRVLSPVEPRTAGGMGSFSPSTEASRFNLGEITTQRHSWMTFLGWPYIIWYSCLGNPPKFWTVFFSEKKTYGFFRWLCLSTAYKLDSRWTQNLSCLTRTSWFILPKSNRNSFLLKEKCLEL